ncbi:hypothetical protein [Micromonospora endophytica]|uniref:Uncharacterized protein n=1 Tax=Micromonospora endophytica TaxID=515350 RepID=A0A2W2CHT4_9ACTN|nr:hypothetical protein [Micromonospora endophytica]PZF87849.1 hypothetical protein C1I93_25710 [Micromonospora endophytica]RIW49143.1 hypothetical protein D3H59_05235 [Micromonospora endophytica]BCJ59096.1 hypothetical protein Jiend_25180 [Micromonospora endophytica]
MLDESGLWWIAGNLMRDAAALHAVEVLPWDVWGVMPAPNEKIDGDRCKEGAPVNAWCIAGGPS